MPAVSVVHLRPEDLPAVLRGHQKKLPKAVESGLNLAAQRARTLLVRASPVDQGLYKNSWRIRKQGGAGPVLYNDSPIAGIIELGARPHGVDKAGIDALTEWAKRKLTIELKQITRGPNKGKTQDLDTVARGIAFAIAAKLKTQGQKGLYIVANNMPTIAHYMAQEVARAVTKALAGK